MNISVIWLVSFPPHRTRRSANWSMDVVAFTDLVLLNTSMWLVQFWKCTAADNYSLSFVIIIKRSYLMSADLHTSSDHVTIFGVL